MAIADLRKEYSLGGLDRKDLAGDPVEQFKQWFSEARQSGRLRKFFVNLYKALMLLAGKEAPDMNAMTLATADKSGRPSARVVLLKGVDDRGFIFFTNYRSRKGREITDNPQAALVFYWPDLERQVCVRGSVSILPEQESEAYFRSRPRGSRIGAWASNQSQVVKDRNELEALWRDIEKRYPGEDVPKPEHWGGFILVPQEIEFWQGRPSRMHDRFQYSRDSTGKWVLDRLAP